MMKGEEWSKLDKADKLLYRTADVIEFFRREVNAELGSNEWDDVFESVWHYLLGTVEMKDNDPDKYQTSLD